ncbi:MAG: hypothetical protein KA314_05130 [Chloroflexi bacterium]|nr:hypothetical protein [Chloroflexota bacterium]
MANVTYGDKIFGLRDLKVTNIGGTTQEDLDAAQTLSFKFVFQGDNLMGDDALKSTINFATHGEAEVSAGSVSSGALGIMLGVTPATTGSTPNAVTEIQVNAGANMPYFKIYGKSLGEGTDDMHVLLSKVKVKDCSILELGNGQWRISKFTVICVDDATHGIVEIKMNETAATLPTS